jgi:pimeloyl-ACP methyl ester carboxylesterase
MTVVVFLLGIFFVYYYKIESINTQRTKLKVLCLHGYMSNSNIFRDQINNILCESTSFADFIFVDAPYSYQIGKRRRFSWWTTQSLINNQIFSYNGLLDSLRLISKVEEDKGPFDVILGHSQGACLAILLDLLRQQNSPELLLEVGCLTNPSSSVLLSGFIPRDLAFNITKRKDEDIEGESSMGILRSLHVFSDDDEVVSASASIAAMALYRETVPAHKYNTVTGKIKNNEIENNKHSALRFSGPHNPPYDAATARKISEFLASVFLEGAGELSMPTVISTGELR